MITRNVRDFTVLKAVVLAGAILAAQAMPGQADDGRLDVAEKDCWFSAIVMS
ncbi:hypothetical protein ACS3SW_04405 [Roseobacteraceae bacterium S113]